MDINNNKEQLDFDETNEEENSFIDYEDYGIKEVYPDITIKVDRDQYSVFELKRKHGRNLVVLDPDFQRSDVWEVIQRSELIESVLMGIPLPIFYLSENKSGQLVVVDGKQRLTTFFKFFDNDFALKGLKILKVVEGKRFKELDQNLQSKLEDYQIIAQVIKPPTPDRVMFDIFDRVNRGGTRLNQQEMRNALYQGKATKLLKELSKSEEFIKATDSSINDSRMKDHYMILRLISFYLWKTGNLTNLKGEMLQYDSGELDSFLGKAMESLNAMDDQKIQNIKRVFFKTMKNNITVFGNQAFRRTYGERRYPVNLILFDSFGYLFANFDEEICNKNKSFFKQKSKLLMNNAQFSDLLSSDRGRGTSIKSIFLKMDELKKELENDI
ncbi:DUF262 domain-containing protein [Paenibacillus sp. WLX2291]|uniref:DUF262 domain-containing protein n=1 Tax=Paenibacillus sp. WLX2291 TaxID=3296934 RepID=UPI00398449A9